MNNARIIISQMAQMYTNIAGTPIIVALAAKVSIGQLSDIHPKTKTKAQNSFCERRSLKESAIPINPDKP